MSSRPIDPIRPGFDLNCDLGEGESPAQARALLGLVDSANIACGAHAGSDESMRRCLEVAHQLGVRAGAHPGFPSRADFGRGPDRTLAAAELVALLEEQVGRLGDHARALGVSLHHVKLHGALYHAVESGRALAGEYLDWMRRRWPGVRVYARAGGAVECENTRSGWPVDVWAEAFLDRGYRDDGTLVPRQEAGALLEDPASVLERLRDLRERGGLRTCSGAWLSLRPRTLCVHGDGLRSREILTAVRGMMPAERS